MELGNVSVLDSGSICIHGKEYSDNLHSIKNTRKDLTLKQVFEISEKLTIEHSDEMRFLECLKPAEKILHGNNYLWTMMKKSSVSHIHQILFGNDRWVGSKIHHNTELWTQLTENRWISSGIFSQDSLHCSSSKKSKS